jgi:hypothetical protein
VKEDNQNRGDPTNNAANTWFHNKKEREEGMECEV